jgi:hypothetical protein
LPEAVLFESRRHGWVGQHGEVTVLGFGRWDEADGLQKPAIVEPVYPLEGCELDSFEVAPRPSSVNDLGFVEAIDRLGQRVVVRVADAAYGRFDPGFSETLGVLDRNILAAPIAMVDEATTIGGRSVMKRLLQGIQDKSACAALLARQPTIRRA